MFNGLLNNIVLDFLIDTVYMQYEILTSQSRRTHRHSRSEGIPGILSCFCCKGLACPVAFSEIASHSQILNLDPITVAIHLFQNRNGDSTRCHLAWQPPAQSFRSTPLHIGGNSIKFRGQRGEQGIHFEDFLRKLSNMNKDCGHMRDRSCANAARLLRSLHPSSLDTKKPQLIYA
mmetsp:Transcript_16406/g.21549  ORF Transcript_16406/g.21549 Transcript_16406/m.21549 type:complete len:175 (+) Transcript_16406:82-606(+)